MALDLQQRSDFGVFARCCFVRYTNDKKHSWSEPYQQAIPVLQGPGQGSPRHRKQVRDTTGQQALRVLTATVQQESANYGNEMGPRATPWVSRGAQYCTSTVQYCVLRNWQCRFLACLYRSIYFLFKFGNRFQCIYLIISAVFNFRMDNYWYFQYKLHLFLQMPNL